MSSKNYNTHHTSTSAPSVASLGDEWFNPSTNKLYKFLAKNGSPGWYELSEAVESNITLTLGTTDSNSVRIISNNNEYITVDPNGDIKLGTINNNITFDSSDGSLYLNGVDADIHLNGITNEPASPASNKLVLYSKDVAGRML